MKRTPFNLVNGLALVAASLTFCSAASAAVVYDNTVNYQTNFFFPTPHTREFGDQVILAPGGDRIMTRFEFEYFAANITGLETMTLRFYTNTNPTNSPPSVLLLSLGPIGVQNVPAGQPGNTVIIDGLFLPVQDSFTWTVQFNGVGGVTDAGLNLYDDLKPPTIGSGYDDFWQRNDDGVTWAAFRFPGGVPVGSFGARVTAVPEPATIVYTLLGGVLIVGGQFLRRRRS